MDTNNTEGIGEAIDRGFVVTYRSRPAQFGGFGYNTSLYNRENEQIFIDYYERLIRKIEMIDFEVGKITISSPLSSSFLPVCHNMDRFNDLIENYLYTAYHDKIVVSFASGSVNILQEYEITNLEHGSYQINYHLDIPEENQIKPSNSYGMMFLSLPQEVLILNSIVFLWKVILQ